MRRVPRLFRIARTQRFAVQREGRYLAVDDADFQRTRGEILRAEICTRRDVAACDERFGHAAQQQVDTVAAELPADERGGDLIERTRAKDLVAGELNVVNSEERRDIRQGLDIRTFGEIDHCRLRHFDLWRRLLDFVAPLAIALLLQETLRRVLFGAHGCTEGHAAWRPRIRQARRRLREPAHRCGAGEYRQRAACEPGQRGAAWSG